MGCDIHIVLEQKLPDSEWVGIWCSDVGPRKDGRALIAQRDYAFFGEVAHVRAETRTGAYPRNLPRDVSRLAWLRYMRSPTDYHNPSHMTLGEFTDAWFRANPNTQTIRREFAVWDLLGVDIDEGDEAQNRVVFWFDN